jgi:hypothetical protein
LAGGNTIGRKLGEFRADFVKRKPYPLCEDDKGDAAQHRSGIAAMASIDIQAMPYPSA